MKSFFDILVALQIITPQFNASQELWVFTVSPLAWDMKGGQKAIANFVATCQKEGLPVTYTGTRSLYFDLAGFSEIQKARIIAAGETSHTNFKKV